MTLNAAWSEVLFSWQPRKNGVSFEARSGTFVIQHWFSPEIACQVRDWELTKRLYEDLARREIERALAPDKGDKL